MTKNKNKLLKSEIAFMSSYLYRTHTSYILTFTNELSSVFSGRTPFSFLYTLSCLFLRIHAYICVCVAMVYTITYDANKVKLTRTKTPCPSEILQHSITAQPSSAIYAQNATL